MQEWDHGTTRMQNHFKAVCKLMQWQQEDWQGGKTVHNIGPNGDLDIVEPEEQDRSFDVVRE